MNINEALDVAIETIKQLAEQQAMPDAFYEGNLQELAELRKLLNGEGEGPFWHRGSAVLKLQSGVQLEVQFPEAGEKQSDLPWAHKHVELRWYDSNAPGADQLTIDIYGQRDLAVTRSELTGAEFQVTTEGRH